MFFCFIQNRLLIRHFYGCEKYDKRIEAGMPEYKARKEDAELLGHGCDDVTRQ